MTYRLLLFILRIYVRQYNRNGRMNGIMLRSFLKLHMVGNDVVAELVEEDVPSIVGVDLVEYRLGVGHLEASLLQKRNCLFELLQGHSSVLAGVDLVEHKPIVRVVSQILNQVFELRLGNIVVAVRRGSLQGGLGSIEGPDEDGLKLKELWKLDDISDSLVDLCQTEVPVPVDVEVRPVLCCLS